MNHAPQRLDCIRDSSVPVSRRLPVRVLPSLRGRLSQPCPGCGKWTRSGRRCCDECWVARLKVVADRLARLDNERSTL
jgi:hypothetical protein